ncbi:MAG: nickel-dependent lactate racemase [Pirellulaceae bacterium]|nr:nickel-dependent lactate racemase [Pirellulaceae bacterium]
MPQYPQVFRLRQTFDRPRVADVAAEVEAELAKLSLETKVQPGQSVAITAGSRGVANIHLIIKAIAEHFKKLGAQPFLVPAMGSHAGGTAEGQRRLIEEYGITEAFCGCPIRAGMETVVVCHAREGFPVHFDRFAHEADHVVVCGRVKPHTSFAGDVESGLMKMMLIGLGKHHGAKIYHRAIMDFSFDQIVRWRTVTTKPPRLPPSGRRSLKPGSKSYSCWPRNGCPACLLTGRTFCWSTSWERTSAAPAWIPTSWVANSPTTSRGRKNCRMSATLRSAA